jgi:hypothetical protein
MDSESGQNAKTQFNELFPDLSGFRFRAAPRLSVESALA